MDSGFRRNEGGGRGHDGGGAGLTGGGGWARDKFALSMSMCAQQGENRPRQGEG